MLLGDFEPIDGLVCIAGRVSWSDLLETGMANLRKVAIESTFDLLPGLSSGFKVGQLGRDIPPVTAEVPLAAGSSIWTSSAARFAGRRSSSRIWVAVSTQTGARFVTATEAVLIFGRVRVMLSESDRGSWPFVDDEA